MKTKTRIAIPAISSLFAIIVLAATPAIMGETDQKWTPNEDAKYAWKDGAKHKGHKAILVEEFVGNIPINKDSTHETLKEQVTVSLSKAAQGLDVKMGKLGIAVNEDGEKFLVWKLVSIDKTEDSETKTATIYIVDAGKADNIAQITKHLDYTKTRHGEYNHYKMKAKFVDLTEEQRAEKMAQLKEMKEAFAALTEEELKSVMSHFHAMKGEFSELTEAEKDAKREQLKEEMQAFMELTLEEKISYLKYLAQSIKNQA